MTELVSLSGGIGSWGAGMRAAEEHGPENVRLVFTDTLIEDRDCYRFLLEGAETILNAPGQYRQELRALEVLPDVERGAIGDRKDLLAKVRKAAMGRDDRLVWLCDGRTPVEVFFDVGFFGNTRADPCSRILKRDLYRSWLEATYEPGECVTHLGLDWTEMHRVDAFARNWEPWDVRAPLCDPPLVMKADLKAWALSLDVEPPAMYAEGFSHANCSGGCVKAGHGQWALLLRQRPEVFAYWEDAENRFRQETGHDVSILRDRRDTGDGGKVKPFTLSQLRERVACGDQIDMLDIGGCGCFVDTEAV